ncbi:hypothetical protein TSAR_004163, partial [Trichomalopsis sarcophagae]
VVQIGRVLRLRIEKQPLRKRLTAITEIISRGQPIETGVGVMSPLC